VGARRSSAGPQAGNEACVGSGGREAHSPLQERLQVDLSLWLRPSEERKVFWMILPSVNAE
jgi:hypothetical protein